VSLFSGEQWLASAEKRELNSHAKYITILIDEVMKQASIKMHELAAIAVSEGPGSYTGLRVGVSAAKGLAYALALPLIAIDTLKIMSAAALPHLTNKSNIILCPMIDARRMEVYTCMFNERLEKLDVTHPAIFNDEYVSNFPKENIYLFGNGASKSQALFAPYSGVNFIEHIEPSSVFMGKFALEKLEAKQFEDVAYFEPFYLKEFIGTQPKKNNISQ
jgi:tRNA threonylcarbamoyladenosine biosynthesis protein TsaB